jgi:hypothetical protein
MARAANAASALMLLVAWRTAASAIALLAGVGMGVYAVTGAGIGTMVVCPGKLSWSEYEGLYGVYTGTSDVSWRWRKPYSYYGNPWNFSGYNGVNDDADEDVLYRPCGDRWQGILCADANELNSTSCTIFSVNLASYSIQGTISSSIGQLTSLAYLTMSFNSLSGMIPSSLQYLTSLKFIDLGRNFISGSIPSELITLSSLNNLYLEYNCLGQNIPSELFHIESLENIYINDNQLTGTIPSSIGKLTNLQLMSANNNALSGPIPEEIGNLGLLNSFSLSGNVLTGEIPFEIGHTTACVTADFTNNMFSGSLPSVLWSLPKLSAIKFSGNYFTGSISSEIGVCTSLSDIQLELNYLEDTIPTEIGLLKLCVQLYVGENLLKGPIPSDLWYLPRLNDLKLSGNFISTTIPTEIGRLQAAALGLDNCNLYGFLPSEVAQAKVVTLQLNGNYLSGTIPTELTTMVTLNDVMLSDNHFSGTLGILSENLVLFGYLVDNNFFSGSLPSGIFRGMSSAPNIDISFNYLTGPLFTFNQLDVFPFYFADSNFFSGHVPGEAAFRNYSSFQLLTVSNNLLTGPMFLTSAGNGSLLQVLSIADNGFTGSVPTRIFAFPKLEVLIMSGNCFSGQLLPACDGCGANCTNRLRAVSLSELSSGFSCRTAVVPKGLSTMFPNAGYLPRWYMTGSAPISTFLRFPMLASLYLEGNGFTGTLPDAGSFPSKLQNFSVSCNQMTGVVPTAIQTHDGFAYFDISHNRFKGTTTNLFQQRLISGDGRFDVSSNRLSGNMHGIPRNMDWKTFHNSVMKGNLFSVALSSEKVGSDEQGSVMEYNGSVNLDVAMSVSASVFVFVILLAMVKLSLLLIGDAEHTAAGKTELVDWLRHFRELAETAVWWQECYRTTSRTCLGCLLMIASFVLLVATLKCSGLRTEYSTHSFQYSWQLSLVFTHGLAPVVGSVTMLVLSFVALGNIVTGKLPWSGWRVIHPKNCCLFGGTVMASDGWRASYISAVIASSIVINILVVVCANLAYLLAILDGVSHILLIQFSLSFFKCAWNAWFIRLALKVIGFRTDSYVVSFRYVLLLLNLIVIPCFVNSLVSEECFLQLFEQTVTPTVSATCFSFSPFGATITRCASEMPLDAPFTYSYQCSSALITNYVPVLLYAYVLNGFVIPSMLFAAMLSIGYVPDGILRRLLISIVPTIVSSTEDNADEVPLSASPVHFLLDRMSIIAGQSVKHYDALGNQLLLPSSWYAASLLLDVTMFVTFGLAFPYLGAVILVANVNILMVWMVAVGRYRSIRSNSLWDKDHLAPSLRQESPHDNREGRRTTTDAVSRKELLDVIDDALAYSLSKIRLAAGDLLVLLMISFLYWGLFCFDLVADVYGASRGVAAVITIPLVCPVAVCWLVWLSPSFIMCISRWANGAQENYNVGVGIISSQLSVISEL